MHLAHFCLPCKKLQTRKAQRTRNFLQVSLTTHCSGCCRPIALGVDVAAAVLALASTGHDHFVALRACRVAAAGHINQCVLVARWAGCSSLTPLVIDHAWHDVEQVQQHFNGGAAALFGQCCLVAT